MITKAENRAAFRYYSDALFQRNEEAGMDDAKYERCVVKLSQWNEVLRKMRKGGAEN